jgi:hypothetical protein
VPGAYAPAICTECGSEFAQPRRRDANGTCSEACRVRAFNREHPDPPRFRLLVCGWCDFPFVQMGSGRTRVCCTPCGTRSTQLARGGRARASRAGGHSETFYAHEVFQRDEWMCALCLGPIDRTIEHPDPLSPTLDHRFPLELGGPHTLENCQAAHLRCNLWKGNRSQEQIAACIPIYSAVAPRWAGVV